MEYRRTITTVTTVTKINYHFVFCPYRRRKIFDIPGVEARFKDFVNETCAKNGIMVIAMECHHDHVHLFVNTPPQMSPADVMKIIKGGTSRKLRQGTPELAYTRQLWTRSYFYSTAGDVSSETIKRYVETQKTRS